MKTVLIIAYYFPPDGGGGTQRMAKFCKHLPQFGWSPVVVTRQPPRSRSEWEPEDASLLQELGQSVTVIRTPVPASAQDWAAPLAVIDIAHPWLESAFDAAKRVIQERSVDVVLITMSPFDLCYVGQKIQAELKVPVVYDLRDPWALDGWRIHSTRREWRNDFAAMSRSLAQADGVIANTPESSRALMAAVPELGRRNTTIIPNGYDADDFSDIEPPPRSENEKSTFYLIHTGTLHTKIIDRYRGLLGLVRRMRHYFPEPIETAGRTEFYLLKAIRILRERKDPLLKRLQVVLVGVPNPTSLRLIREAGVEDCVRFTGYLPHLESVQWLARADALFLPLHGLPPGKRSLIVPGKVYEYVASGKPMLACLPPGDAREIIEESGRGVFADPCDAPAIAAALQRLVAACDAGEFQGHTLPPSIRRFERLGLTESLSGFLDRVSGSSVAGQARHPEIRGAPFVPPQQTATPV